MYMARVCCPFTSDVINDGAGYRTDGILGHGTEYTANIRNGPGSELLNVPSSNNPFASSKLFSRQCSLVLTSRAMELQDSGEHSAEFPVENVTMS